MLPVVACCKLKARSTCPALLIDCVCLDSVMKEDKIKKGSDTQKQNYLNH